ncbi:hypothetical protein [Paenibacillus sp. 481]|uniref:hypothetical protein n=1 Tax=Paenibacillus sp. 481 TaxID=2835869 RepID=UPI001E2B6460|nr:hypothetical protein [Paenibacillus sp. 481]UHA74671.1 hypothetical protein KIK04_06210 [Paenibacillus sp. 481]
MFTILKTKGSKEATLMVENIHFSSTQVSIDLIGNWAEIYVKDYYAYEKVSLTELGSLPEEVSTIIVDVQKGDIDVDFLLSKDSESNQCEIGILTTLQPSKWRSLCGIEQYFEMMQKVVMNHFEDIDISVYIDVSETTDSFYEITCKNLSAEQSIKDAYDTFVKIIDKIHEKNCEILLENL